MSAEKKPFIRWLLVVVVAGGFAFLAAVAPLPLRFMFATTTIEIFV